MLAIALQNMVKMSNWKSYGSNLNENTDAWTSAKVRCVCAICGTEKVKVKQSK